MKHIQINGGSKRRFECTFPPFSASEWSFHYKLYNLVDGNCNSLAPHSDGDTSLEGKLTIRHCIIHQKLLMQSLTSGFLQLFP